MHTNMEISDGENYKANFKMIFNSFVTELKHINVLNMYFEHVFGLLYTLFVLLYWCCLV